MTMRRCENKTKQNEQKNYVKDAKANKNKHNRKVDRNVVVLALFCVFFLIVDGSNHIFTLHILRQISPKTAAAPQHLISSHSIPSYPSID